ncbi:MAG: hypothetical protein ONA69_02640 [candidate division KSB1 bacterium]|nr:hypothetical protein [candidate division KSB1 bacterium]MDZ7345669.1 hypothetical protein [candidate division KSB1 bacterium]
MVRTREMSGDVGKLAACPSNCKFSKSIEKNNRIIPSAKLRLENQTQICIFAQLKKFPKTLRHKSDIPAGQIESKSTLYAFFGAFSALKGTKTAEAQASFYSIQKQCPKGRR